MTIAALWKRRSLGQYQSVDVLRERIVIITFNDDLAHRLALVRYKDSGRHILPICKTPGDDGVVIEHGWITHPGIEELGANPKATAYCKNCIVSRIPWPYQYIPGLQRMLGNPKFLFVPVEELKGLL